jgi:methyl-accepting chemotaxis protein
VLYNLIGPTADHIASEVRALAQRASESAREIKTLISASSTQVVEGSRLVVLTGERLEEILSHTIEVQSIVSDIAGAAREQAAGLGEINSGVNQLDTVTQQNAAVAEEANAASSSLLQKSDDLLRSLGQFRTIGGSKVVAFSPRARSEALAAPKKDWLGSIRSTATGTAGMQDGASPTDFEGF